MNEQGTNIQPQSFLTALFLCVFYIISEISDTISALILVDYDSLWHTILTLLLEIGIWLELRKYLMNFKNDNVVILTNWIISFIILVSIFLIIYDYYGYSNSDSLSIDLITVFAFIIMLVFCVLSIWLGVILQKIKNEPSKYLKTLGATLSYLLPITILLFLVYLYSESPIIYLLYRLSTLIPYFVLMLMFHRLWHTSTYRKR